MPSVARWNGAEADAGAEWNGAEVRPSDRTGGSIRFLDYTIARAEGTGLIINAGEEPSEGYERAGEQRRVSSQVVGDWRFVAAFRHPSSPQPAE